MPVNNPCKAYKENFPQWQIVRDCVEGETAIKAAGKKYLPKPSGQSANDYLIYKERPKFFDATSRTAEGYHGHVFSKAPIQTGEVSEQFTENLKDIDATGTSIDEFASKIVWDAIQTGFGGILVDYTSVPEGTSEADAQGGAFLKWYPAESIIKWKHSTIQGKKVLSLVVLREDNEQQDPNDEFEYITNECYRVLQFDENSLYIQRIFEKSKDEKAGFVEIKNIIEPEINGERLKKIPFYMCPDDEPEKSMLLGLAFENIGHYQKTADYENGLHFTGCPTAIAENMEQPFEEVELEVEENGVKKKKKKRIPQKVLLGGSLFKFFSQKNQDGVFSDVRVKYLEFTGNGLSALLAALNGCLDRMAKLGIQAIGSEKKGVETAEVAKLHRAAEHGVLGAFIRSMNNSITPAVRQKMIWDGIPEDEANGWAYEMSTQFNFAELSAQILAIMHSARQSDEIPRSVWFKALKQAGMIPDNMTFEEFIVAIENDKIILRIPGCE